MMTTMDRLRRMSSRSRRAEAEDAGSHADPLGRRRSRSAKDCSIRRRGSRGRGRNIARAIGEDPGTAPVAHLRRGRRL